jgi:MFS family permease
VLAAAPRRRARAATPAVPIALLSLPLGRAADRFGRRALLSLGLLLVAAGSVLTAESRSLVLLIAARVIQGIGSAASWISALARDCARCAGRLSSCLRG